MIHDRRRELELLRDERVDAGRIVGTDHAPRLGPEDTQTGPTTRANTRGIVVVELRVASSAPAQRDAQVVDVPHELHAVRLRLEPGVDLQERDYPLIFPQVGRGALSSDQPIERGVGEEYRPEHLIAVEGFAGNGARIFGHETHAGCVATWETYPPGLYRTGGDTGDRRDGSGRRGFDLDQGLGG